MPTAQKLPETPTRSFALVNEEAAFLELGPEWDELLVRSSADSLFMTWDYVSTWWSVYRDRCQLRVLTARDDEGRLVGLAPLVLGRGEGPRRHLRFLTFLGALGDSLSEYLDVIVLRGLEEEVVPELWRIMSTELDGWDVLSLPLVPSSSSTPGLLFRAPGREAERLRRSDERVSPFIRLDTDWETYLGSRSKNFRKAFHGVWNRVHRRHDVRVLHAGSDVPVDEALDRLIALNHARWGEAGVAFHTPQFCEFHRQLAPKLLERGRLSLMILQLDGADAAIRYDFVYAGRLWVFQGGWRPELRQTSPGRILTGYSVQWCIDQGLSEYDFLVGDDAYKRDWATDLRHLVDLELSHPRSVRGKAYTALRATRRFVKR